MFINGELTWGLAFAEQAAKKKQQALESFNNTADTSYLDTIEKAENDYQHYMYLGMTKNFDKNKNF